MKVRSAYRPEAEAVAPESSLREAAKRMRSSGLSCLPVLDGEWLVGIVTERDLVGAMANGIPASACIGPYASDGGVTVSLDDDCEMAELKMLAIGCRNLPVIDGHRLVGMISMRDVILKDPAGSRQP